MWLGSSDCETAAGPPKSFNPLLQTYGIYPGLGSPQDSSNPNTLPQIQPRMPSLMNIQDFNRWILQGVIQALAEAAIFLGYLLESLPLAFQRTFSDILNTGKQVAGGVVLRTLNLVIRNG